MTGWLHDESPRLSYPDRVELDGDEYEVLGVDVLGRWHLVYDGYEHYEERYADPSRLMVPPVYDNRRVLGCEDITSMGYMMKRALAVTMESYKDVLREQLEQPNYLLTLLQK